MRAAYRARGSHNRQFPVADRTSDAILLVLIAVGAVLRLWGLRFGLPHPFARPDEEVIVDVALGVLTDPNPHFFDWPTLFMYVTAAVYAALFAVERAIGGAITSATIAKAAFEPVLHVIPRVLSAAAGVLTIPVLYGAARELFPRRVALIAAAFLAFTFLHVRDSHFGVTDVPVTFLTVCAFWAALRCATRGVTQTRAATAGLLCGLAASTKYNAALVMLPALVAILGGTIAEGPRSTGIAVRAVASLLLAAAVGFVAGTPYSLLDYRTFLTAVLGVGRHLAAGHVVMARGWTYHAEFTLRHGMGIAMMIAATAGAFWLIARERWTAALVLVFPVSYYALLGSGQTVFVRYMMPMVPFLCLTAACAVDAVATALGNRFKAGGVRVALLAGLSAIVIAPTAVASIAFDRLMARPDTRVIGGDWIVSQFPAGASIYQSGHGYGHVRPRPLERYTQYLFNEPSDTFEVNGHATTDLPDLIVLLDSPIGTYTTVPPRISTLAATKYGLVKTVEGVPAGSAAGALYDQDDAFFAPYAGIERVRLPGPNIRIFERQGR